MAPSAENRHLLRVEKEKDAIALVPDARYWSDHPARRRLHQMGFGAVAENIRVAAAADGLEARVTWPGATEAAQWTGRITLAPAEAGGACDAALARAIPLRCTNRTLSLRGPAVPPAQRGAFHDALSSLPGIGIFWPAAVSARRRLYRVLHCAESARFSNPVLHRELFSGIRFDAGWNASTAEGIPPGALQVERGARTAFAQLRHWPVANLVRRLGLHHLIGMRAALLPFMLSPDIVVVTCSSDSSDSWCRAGQALQRLWLMATAAGYAVQPAAAAALYVAEGFPGVPAELQRKLSREWARLMGHQRKPCILLRIGHAAVPPIRAARPALDRFIHDPADPGNAWRGEGTLAPPPTD